MDEAHVETLASPLAESLKKDVSTNKVTFAIPPHTLTFAAIKYFSAIPGVV